MRFNPEFVRRSGGRPAPHSSSQKGDETVGVVLLRASRVTPPMSCSTTSRRAIATSPPVSSSGGAAACLPAAAAPRRHPAGHGGCLLRPCRFPAVSAILGAGPLTMITTLDPSGAALFARARSLLVGLHAMPSASHGQADGWFHLRLGHEFLGGWPPAHPWPPRALRHRGLGAHAVARHRSGMAWLDVAVRARRRDVGWPGARAGAVGRPLCCVPLGRAAPLPPAIACLARAARRLAGFVGTTPGGELSPRRHHDRDAGSARRATASRATGWSLWPGSGRLLPRHVDVGHHDRDRRRHRYGSRPPLVEWRALRAPGCNPSRLRRGRGR